MIPWRDIASDRIRSQDQDWGSPLARRNSSSRREPRVRPDSAPAPPSSEPAELIDLTWADEPLDDPRPD